MRCGWVLAHDGCELVLIVPEGRAAGKGRGNGSARPGFCVCVVLCGWMFACSVKGVLARGWRCTRECPSCPCET